MEKVKPLDKIDCAIIKLLQKDGRISNTDIAKKINVSEGTVRIRLNRLIKNETIQIVAVSNPIKLGFKIVGHLRINVEAGQFENVANELIKLEKLWFVVLTTGGTTGIDAEFIAESVEEFNELILNKINKISGVINVQTTLILDIIKRRYDWGAGERNQ